MTEQEFLEMRKDRFKKAVELLKTFDKNIGEGEGYSYDDVIYHLHTYLGIENFKLRSENLDSPKEL